VGAVKGVTISIAQSGNTQVVEAAREAITSGIIEGTSSPTSAFGQAFGVTGKGLEGTRADCVFHIAEVVAFRSTNATVGEHGSVRAVKGTVVTVGGIGTSNVNVVGSAFQRVTRSVAEE